MARTGFQEVKDDLRQRIVEGVWAPGALIPYEVDLAAEFDCARATVNRALRELAEEGLVERKRKAGTRVRATPLRRARFDIPMVRAEIEALGATYGYALLDRETLPAPRWLRVRLALTPPSPMLHLMCLHRADGAPYQVEDRWISLAALPQAAEADFTAEGPNEWLIRTVPFSDVEISFSASAADHPMAERLGCARGAPVFVTERTTWWQEAPVTHVRLIHRPGHRITTRY